MFRELRLSIGLGAALLGGIANAQSVITTADLDPFTHVALVPAESDLASIQFQSVKRVQIPTKSRSVTTVSYCRQLAFRDPGGSMFCPQTQLEAKVPAYKVTYSYTSPAMMSDEYDGRSFTFSVYYRPEELPSSVRRAISQGKEHNSDVAVLFDVKTSRASEQRTAVDIENSKSCGRNLIDGVWIQSNSRCTADVKYKTITVAADSVTVRIDPSLPTVSQR